MPSTSTYKRSVLFRSWAGPSDQLLKHQNSHGHLPSGSISSPSSTSSPAPSPEPGLISLIEESLGRLKLVLRLELVLADRPDPGGPLLEIEVLRDDGPDVSAPVDETGDCGGGDSAKCPVRLSWGISKLNSIHCHGRMDERYTTCLLRSRLSLHCI